MIEDNKAITEFIIHIGESLEDAIQDVDDYNDYTKTVLEVVLPNRSAIMADALECWKKSGLTKGEFIYAMKDYLGYTVAVTDMLCAVIALSDEVIPGEHEVPFSSSSVVDE